MHHPMPDMHDHQMTALKKLSDGKILWGGVGSGKSRVALAYYMNTEQHEDLYVITTAKKRDELDWDKEATKFGIGRKPEASFAGKLTVDSWNNLHKYKDVKNAFFIFDEQRLVGKGQWVKAFLKISKENRWIMLSATPGDTWLDYIPVFIANGFYRNRTEFLAKHAIFNPHVKYQKVDRYVDVHTLVRHRSSILVHMPYERETVRHNINCWVDYDVKQLARVEETRWNVYEDRPIREAGEYFRIMRQVVNTDPSRLAKLRMLLEKHQRLIVFYNWNYELEILRQLENWDLTYAEWNGHKHEPLPTGDKWVYVVQYSAGAEGWNCTTTDAMAFYSLPDSYKLWEQAHGRIDRLDTDFRNLYYYALRSKSAIDWAIWRSLKSKKNFQHADFGIKNSEFAEQSAKNLQKNYSSTPE